MWFFIKGSSLPEWNPVVTTLTAALSTDQAPF